MKKLEDYKGQKIAIRCKKDDEIRAILKLNNTCLDVDRVIELKNKEDNSFVFCYNICDDLWEYESFYIEQGYTILPATDFLEDEFIYGQEYEFSDDEDFRNKTIALYGCKYPKESESNYNFIAFTKQGFMMPYTYARKINTEKAEAITTIKELVSKHSINQNEVF